MKRSSLPTLILLAIYLSIPSAAALTYLERLPVPQLPLQIPVHSFNGSKAYQLLENLTRDFPGRVIGSKNDSLAASWIASWFQGLGLNVTTQTFPAVDFQGEKVNGTNVYAVSPGRTNQVLILLAHHDVVPRTQQGADDNGSGTVILMELARTLTKSAHNLTYYFLSTDSEEINLGGSLYFAQHTARHLNITLALSIDEVGYKDAKGLIIYAYSHQNNYADAGPMLAASSIGQKLNLTTTPQILDQIGHRAGITLFTSDSESFLSQGIQSYALADDNPLYPYTHTPQDTLDQVSATRLDNVGRWVETLTHNLNQGLVIPTLGETYLIYPDGYTPGNQLILNIATYALAAIAVPVWLLLRQKPRRDALVRAGKPVLITFLILLAAAALPLIYRVLGLWPPSTSVVRDLLSIFYVGEALAVMLLLSLFSEKVYGRLRLTRGEGVSENRDLWLAILLSGTYVINILASPFVAILFLSLPTLLPPITRIRRQDSNSLNLFAAMLTPFPLYAAAIGGVAIFGPQGGISVAVGQIVAGGPILIQLSSTVAILISLGYSIRESLT